jgi:thioredoxin-like negative regulator of GroEL
MAMPTTDNGWARDVIGSDAPVIVELWSINCNVCTQYDLAVKRMAARFYGQARVLQLNVDENPKTMALYKITGVPTVLLFNKGELLRTMIGPKGEQGIRTALGLD